MNVETRNITVSFDSPDRMLNALRSALEQTAGVPRTRTDHLPAPVPNGQQQVGIIERVNTRAEYLARLTWSAGYQPYVAGSALDAYTAFLQGTFRPIAIILTSEDAADSLFLRRLQQRTLQQYHREVPLIRLYAETVTYTSTSPALPAPLALPAPSSSQAQPRRRIQPERVVRPGTRSSAEPTGQQSTRLPRVTQPLNNARTQVPPAAPRPRLASPALSSRVPAETRGDLWRVRTEPLPRVQTAPLSEPPAHTPFLPTFRIATSPMPAIAPGPVSTPGMIVPLPPPSSAGQESIVEIKEADKKSLVGQNMGRYQILRLLGGSPLGDVYMVYDRLRETSIAFKSIQGNMLPDGFLEDAYVNTNLFQQEADALTNLKHPHILPVMSASKTYTSGTPFYYKAMPLCKDGSLAGWLYEHAATGQFALQDVLPIAMQIADALQFAHINNVIYQNFKLTNVLLEGEAASDISRLHVQLADFALTGDNKHVLRTPNTLRYLAPEQWSGQALPASDQYGLAALLYELLTGRPPFQGTQEHLLRHMHITMQPQPPSAFNATLSFEADAAILRALSKNPHDRFSSIAEFARALRASV